MSTTELNTSLELLFLRDLQSSHYISEDLYSRAVSKILKRTSTEISDDESTRASA